MTSQQADPLSREDRLAAALVSCLEAMDNGAPLDRKALQERYPEFANEIARFLDDQEQVECRAAPLRMIAGIAAVEPGQPTSVPKKLGDFRIVREVGRGGMGVVYEAIQQSLGRRVALKVLPFAATMDERHLQRFSNEAKAAACLHHTNIVPVFFVGCERGLHFYAMQFIDGQPLSEIICQMRQRDKKAQPEEGEKTIAYELSAEDGASTPLPAAELTPWTDEGRRNRDYYRKVAELGIQAAEALDHAHQLGIVHRDIKPGNLLLDGMGRLWVTDFGLAHMQHGEAGLTLTGQALGTPRYMSPEQALAKRVPIDHRTDVYSLGVTLYEMLALRPAFADEDRHELVRQIASEEPVRLRRLERGIPAELEIIVLKAMEKRPQDRYATAQELADDLERWLKHEPIRARKPSWVQVVRKWSRRHQAVVWSAALVLLILLIFVAGNALWLMRQQMETEKKRTEAETEARAALQEAERWQQDERWPEALSAVRRAQGVLRGFGSDALLRQQAEELAKDVEMAQRLEEAQLLYTAIKDDHFDYETSSAAYREAFAWYGLDVEHLDTGTAADSIRSRPIQKQLVAALDMWARCKRWMKDPEWKHLLAVARAIDADPWRNRLRQAWEREDGNAYRELLASADVEAPLPTTLGLLEISSSRRNNSFDEQAAILLRRAQQRHPTHFWINHDLAVLLHHAQPPQLEEAIGYFRAAVALRPQSPGVHVNLGNALKDKGRLDDAIAEFREALRIKKDFALAHRDLGEALRDKGLLDDALVECREALRSKKDYALAHNSLGNVLRVKGHLDDAIVEYREALRIKKDYAEAHCNLGLALGDRGQWDDALAECREALRIKEDFASAHDALGYVLYAKGQVDEAIAEFREAIRLNKDVAEFHNNLGNALKRKGQPDEAIAEYREAIRLNTNSPEAHNNLGTVLSAKGQRDAAIAEYREAIRLKENYPDAHNNLGNALRDKGQLDEAIAEYREASRLNKDHAAAHHNLGIALIARSRLEEAIAEFREAIRLNKDFAEAHAALGVALAEKGRLNEAAAEYREAIRLKPDLALARNNLLQVEQMARLDDRFGHILEGKDQPKDAAERLAFASLCQKIYKKHYAAAVRFYSEAFAEKPQLADNLNTQHRYSAACAAALAGCGQGKDADKLDAKDRARLRQQALGWLRADLKAYRQVLEKSAGKAGPLIAQRMQNWLNDPDFSGVRGDKVLGKLPEAERKDWHKLWKEVEELRQRAAQPPKTASSARP